MAVLAGEALERVTSMARRDSTGGGSRNPSRGVARRNHPRVPLSRRNRPAELEPGLRVDYDPPQLSVEAREVSLGAVLRAIGAKVGFSVVETVPSSRVVTLSIRNASLDDVLRQLLRAKNHTMLYRVVERPSAESGTIDRIVLFGDSVAGHCGGDSARRLLSGTRGRRGITVMRAPRPFRSRR